jgi:hypothetical protein
MLSVTRGKRQQADQHDQQDENPVHVCITGYELRGRRSKRQHHRSQSAMNHAYCRCADTNRIPLNTLAGFYTVRDNTPIPRAPNNSDYIGQLGSIQALEMKSDLGGDGTRTDVMRAAERRQEVIERVIVGQVNQRQLRAPAVTVAFKQVVLTQGKIKKIA